MSHTSDKPNVTITKAGVMQVKPSAIIRSANGMQQIRRTHEVFVRISKKQDSSVDR